MYFFHNISYREAVSVYILIYVKLDDAKQSLRSTIFSRENTPRIVNKKHLQAISADHSFYTVIQSCYAWPIVFRPTGCHNKTIFHRTGLKILR